MAKPKQRTLDRIEDAQFLLDAGEHPARIAHRLGMTLAGLCFMFKRAGIYNTQIAVEYTREQRENAARNG